MATATAIATAEQPGDEWLTGAAAARALKVGDKRAVKRLVALGRIRVRDLPVSARYSAADVERLAAQQQPENT